MGARKPPVTVPCTGCGAVFTLKLQQRAYWRKAGKAYCSPECSRAAVETAKATRTVSSEHRAALSRHMTERNPMADPDARSKMSASLRARGHQPLVRGGNGRGLSEPQRLLAERLGWLTELIVPTGNPTVGPSRVPGLPSHYKLDIADPELMIAVEVDGGSHCSLERKAQDRRKGEWLTGEGWTVLRFSNQEVMADTAACARTVMSTTSKSRGHTPTSSPMAS